MEEREFEFDLGDVVLSNITGFVGTITSRCESINSPNEYYLQPFVSTEESNKYPDGRWLYESELQKTGEPVKV